MSCSEKGEALETGASVSRADVHPLRKNTMSATMKSVVDANHSGAFPGTGRTRAAAIAAKCRDCCHDPEVAGTWRQQAAVCSVTTCPLWAYRPIPRAAPAWLASRSVEQLPPDWAKLQHESAVECIRETKASRRIAPLKPRNEPVHTDQQVKVTPTPVNADCRAGGANGRAA